MEVIVVVLSILVTVLMGWQIWNVIFLEKRIRQIIRNESKENYNLLYKEIYNSLVESLLIQSKVLQFPFGGVNSFKVGLVALSYSLANETRNSESAIEYFLEKFKGNINEIDIDDLEFIRKAIYGSKSSSNKLNELKDYINSLKVK